MPTYHLTAPNGRTYRMQGPPGLSQDDVIAHVLQQDPDAGTPPPPPKTGIGAAFQSGLENLWSSGKAGVKGAFGDTQAAAAEAAAAEQEQGKKYDSQIGLKRLGEVYDKEGILGAGKELVGQGLRGIAQSAPQMATTLGGAAAGARAGSMFGPVGTAVGGIGGGLLAGLPVFTGANLAQQQEATPGKVSYGKALAAGAGQAALEEVAPLALMGTRVASKVFGKDVAGMIAKLGPEAAEEVAKRRLLATVARGGGVGAAGEAGTEVLQDALGRLQSGKSLLDNEALASYAESAYGGALPGGALGAAGHAYDRAGAQRQVADTEQEAQRVAGEQAAQAQAAAEQAAAAEVERKKSDPNYVKQVAADVADYEQKKRAMLTRASALDKDGTDAGKVEAKQLRTMAAEMKREAQPLFEEYIATRSAREVLAAQEAPAAPEGMLFQPEGNPQQGQRIQELQTQIAEHEETLPKETALAQELMRQGKLDQALAAGETLDARAKAHKEAQKELYKLAPALKVEHAAARNAAATADVEAQTLQALNTEQTQGQITKLTAQIDKMLGSGNIKQLPKVAEAKAEIERLQGLLDAQAKQRNAGYDENLFQLDDRLKKESRVSDLRQAGQAAGLEAAGRGEATQPWPSMDVNEQELPGTPYGETPEGMAAETDKAFGRAFAPEPRSGMQDIAGQRATRSADPLLTQAMEQAAEEPPTAPRAPAGRTFPGTAPSDLTATGKASDYALTEPGGQQRLFVPEKGPEATPAEALRQRIGKLIATPKLTPQAKNELQRAADALDAKAVPQRVLENITALADRAERGVGRHQIEPGVKAQRLEGEKVGDAGPDADVQPDLFDTMHVGRATPANFQRALGTGALPSKRGEKAAGRHVEGLLTAGALLRSKAAGLRARVAAAAAARTRLAGVVKEYRDHTPAQRKALADTMHEKMADATKAALKSKDVAAKHAQQARELEELAAGAAGEEAGPARDKHARQARKAAMAEQEALKQAGRVEEFKALRRAVTEADAAPATEEAAARHDALVAELAGVEAEIATNDADLKTRQGEAQAKRKKAGKDVAAPDVERKGPRLLPRQQERVKAPVPTEAARRTAAVNVGSAEYAKRTGEKVTRVQAREAAPGLDITSDAVDDAVDTALAVPGVTKPELQQVFERVRGLTKKRAIDTRAGAVGKQVAVLADDMSRFRAAHPGGVIPGKHGKSHRSAVLEKAHLEARLKATPSADARAPILKRMEVVDKHLDFLNRQRVPHAEAVSYRDMQRRAALLEFERDVIEMQRNAVAAGEGYKALPQAGVLARAEPGTVEPATKLGTDKPATRMALAKEAKAKSKYGFKNRAYSPTEESKQAAEDTKATRSGEDAALKAASEAKVAKGKPAKLTPLQALKAMQEVAAKRTGAKVSDTVPKLTSGDYETISATPLSEWAMERAHDGQLDKVLGFLATDGSTPAVRELAAKLQAFTKNTRLVVSEKTGGADVAGNYDAKTDTITLHPMALTEETALHETVHAATLRALVVPDNQLTREQRNARNELQSMLKQLQKDPAFAKEYGRENIAEFASEVMTNQGLRDKIAAKKPGFIQRFINAVKQMLGFDQRPASAQAMANIEKLFMPSRGFSEAERSFLYKMRDSTAPLASVSRSATPALDAFSAGLTTKPRPQGLAGAKAFLKDANAGLAAEYAAVDQRAPLMKALSKGDKSDYMQGQYFIRKADARMSQVGASLINGTLELKKDAKGNYVVEATGKTSGQDVFDAIKALPGSTPEAKFALAQSYMVAQRAANKGWDKLGWETSAANQALGTRALAEANANPALKAQLENVRKVYNDYNEGMIRFLADTGAIPKKLAQKLTKDGDYVPFYRVGESGAAELVMGENTHIRVGDIRKQPYLQELKGDDTKLLPLSEAIMRNTMLLTDMGLKNLATKNIAYSLQDMSKGAKANVIQRGNAPAGPDIIKFNQEPDREGDNGERWMRVTSAGTPFEGIPAELLVQSLEGSHSMLTGMGKVAGAFSNLLRSGVTRTPAYLIRQLIRDPMSASFTAGINRGPVTAMLESMREFISQTRGTSATGNALLRKGVTQSGIFNGTAEDMEKFALQMAGGDQSAMRKLFAAADRAAMRADAATRAQVYNDTLAKTGSEMEAELAAIEMMNFTKRGASPTVQYATRMIPFMNAQIQALNVLAKAFRGNATMQEKMQIKQKFFKNAMGLAAFSMIYAAGMEDDEDYKNASAHERMNNFFLPTPGGTIKVPIPYEVGFLFKVLPELMMRGLSDKLDPTDWEAFRGSVLGMVPGGTSMGMPQMIAPIVQSITNRDAFGNKIETDAQQKLAKSERRGDNTSEIGMALSGLMGAVLPESMQLSAPKIEHLVRGYVGGMPVAIAGMADEFLSDANRPERMASQNPIYGAFVPKNVGTGPVSSGYAALSAVEQANATLAHLREEAPEKAEAYAEEHAGEINAKEAASAFKQQLKGLKEQQAGIMADKAMLAADKRKALDDLARLRNLLAREFTQNVRALATSP